MITQTFTRDLLPAPLARSGYLWRPLRREDLPALYDMLLAVSQADDRTNVGTLADMETQFDDPWSNPATDSLVTLTPEGQVAALARTFVNPQPVDESRAYLDCEVHPAHRGRGLEAFVLTWAEARGSQRLRPHPASLRRSLRHSCQDTLTSQVALLEQHGFRPDRYFYRMRRDLRQPIPDQPLMDGLTLRTYTPGVSRALLDAFNESFRDHWNFEGVTEEDWRMFFLERTSFRPDLTFLGMDGDQLAGFSFNTVNPEENARQNIKEGWVAELGVRRPWRKRGVASALLCQTMRAFRAEGLDHATLGVDTENPTGALRLYERLGFVPVKRFISFVKLVT